MNWNCPRCHQEIKNRARGRFLVCENCASIWLITVKPPREVTECQSTTT